MGRSLSSDLVISSSMTPEIEAKFCQCQITSEQKTVDFAKMAESTKRFCSALLNEVPLINEGFIRAKKARFCSLSYKRPLTNKKPYQKDVLWRRENMKQNKQYYY